MTELETMQRAKVYIDHLANGINPLDGQPLPDGDIVNNVRISRCLFYVSNVLQQVIQNGGTVEKRTKSPKQPFYLDAIGRSKFQISQKPIPITEIRERINRLIDVETMLQLKHQSIISWLMNAGFLAEQPGFDGKMKKYPTEAGNGIGIQLEHRSGIHGNYDVIVYSSQAQQFLLDNLDAIMEINCQKSQKQNTKSE